MFSDFLIKFAFFVRLLDEICVISTILWLNSSFFRNILLKLHTQQVAIVLFFLRPASDFLSNLCVIMHPRHCWQPSNLSGMLFFLALTLIYPNMYWVFPSSTVTSVFIVSHCTKLQQDAWTNKFAKLWVLNFYSFFVCMHVSVQVCHLHYLSFPYRIKNLGSDRFQSKKYPAAALFNKTYYMLHFAAVLLQHLISCERIFSKMNIEHNKN